jgi:hypothetical protein
MGNTAVFYEMFKLNKLDIYFEIELLKGGRIL